jgi:transcriptional regulator with XRE-family HTH domain
MRMTGRHDDATVLAELGQRLARRRLDLDLTQAAAAKEAGISKRTVERMEAGATVQLSSFIRLLRALDLLEALDRLLPEPGPRPLDLLKLQGKQRQRAPSANAVAEEHEPSEWHWEDEA